MTVAVQRVEPSGGARRAIDRASLRQQLRVLPPLIEAIVTPLPLDAALAGLAHQSELAAPAKLMRSATGEAGVLAEIPMNGDRAHAEALAGRALDAALAWLGGDIADTDCGNDAGRRLEQALVVLGWPVNERRQSGYRVTGYAAGVASRVLVDVVDAAVRVAQPATAIRVADERAAEAIAWFALEANARLRLARLSVAPDGAAVVRVVWDAVLHAEAALERWLPEAVNALAVAHAETARALRALGSPPVAAAFLASRGSEFV